MGNREPVPTRAQMIAAELAELQRRSNGVLYPAEIVEFARNPNTALHGRFTWDDGEAAEKWRLAEARAVIRMHVTVIGESATTVRTFVSLSSDRTNGGGYRPIVDILSDADQRARLLADALMDLRRIREKYDRLRELQPIWEALAGVAGNDSGAAQEAMAAAAAGAG